MDSNGNAYVNVGWTDTDDDTKCTSLNITAKTATTPTTDTVDVLTGGISASGNGTSLAGEVATISVPTKKYVDSAIENGVKSLGDVLEFKDSVTSLPATAEKGDVYLVSAAFDSYEVGDLLIYDGSKWVAVNANWTATDGTAQLEWGKTTTLATIGGVTIDATLPSNPNIDHYHTPTETTGLKIATGTGVNDLYVPEAGDTEYGVIKTGYTTNNKNYKVQLDSNGNAFVEVPWKNDIITYINGDGLNLSANNEFSVKQGTGITVNSDGVSLAESGVTSGTYGNNTTDPLSHGDTFDIPTFTVDKYGRITTAGKQTLTLPASDNEDKKTSSA